MINDSSHCRLSYNWCFGIVVAGGLVLAAGVLVFYYGSVARSMPAAAMISGTTHRTAWRPPAPFQSEGIEWGERINEQIMRRHWDELKKGVKQSPIREAVSRKALRDLPIAADLERNQDLFEAESGFNFGKGSRTAVAFRRQRTELSGVVPPCSRRTNRGIQ